MFESYWGLKADCNPLAIAKLLSAHSDFDIVWSFKDKDAVPTDFPFRWVKRGSLRMVLEAVNTRYFISNTNIPDEIEKRKGSVHLQTWHGTPVKVMGLDIRPFNPDELNWEKFAKRSNRSDFVISSNPHSSYVWRRACPYNYKIIETGYPRNDQLVCHTQQDKERIRKLLGIPDGFKVALYAPTIRDEAKGGITPIPPRLFNFEKILAALGDEFVLITRAHYFSRINQNMIDRIIDVSSHPYSNDPCLVSDILITDYSSIMFDYCNLGRPIIIYAYDYEDYAKRRGVYFDITQDSPGLVARSQNELIEILQTRAYEGSESRAKLESFRGRFALWDDGYAAHRVVKTVFGVDIPECSGSVTSDE